MARVILLSLLLTGCGNEYIGSLHQALKENPSIPEICYQANRAYSVSGKFCVRREKDNTGT